MEKPSEKPKGLILLTGRPEQVEDWVNSLTDDYAIMNGVTFHVVNTEVHAACAMINKAELRKAALAARG